MHAIVEVQIIPIGSGVSVRKEVMRAHELLEASGAEHHPPRQWLPTWRGNWRRSWRPSVTP